MNVVSIATQDTVIVGKGIQLIVAPTFHGFHPVYASPYYQMDFCNNVDDVIIVDGATGTLYRVPITQALIPELDRLIAAMNFNEIRSPWAAQNAQVRARCLYAAKRRLDGDKPQGLNMFEPGKVAPTPCGPAGPADEMLARLIAESGDTRIPGQ